MDERRFRGLRHDMRLPPKTGRKAQVLISTIDRISAALDVKVKSLLK